MFEIDVYGRLSEQLGQSVKVAVELPSTIGDVRRQLGLIVDDQRIRFVVNGAIVGDDVAIEDSQHVELLSPLSGG